MKKASLRSAQDHIIWTDPLVFIACGFGVGTFPVMPGTMGTVLGAWLYYLWRPLSIYAQLTALLGLFVLGVYLCGYANRRLGTDDHPAAVWDEFAIFPWVMLGIPFHPLTLLVAFGLFRFFDIIKPGPIGWIDRNCHGGWGVMLDDWVAALASWVVLMLLLQVAKQFVYFSFLF